MYDDLERALRPTPLEWFVVNAVIPSLVVSLAMWVPPSETAEPPGTRCLFSVLIEERGPIPDVFPVLIHMPRASYPIDLKGTLTEGRVTLKALVNRRGVVEPSSIQVLRASDVRFVEPARRALRAASFRSARLSGKRIAAWITITVDFKPPREGTI